jgi:putative transposase
VKFAFIAKNRAAWPADWMCGALGVSRGGFYAWLTRPRSRRSRSDEDLAAKVRASFLVSDRTYGARRVWHDLISEGVSCGLHRIERLMRQQGLKARPRRRRLPPDLGERQAGAIASNMLDRVPRLAPDSQLYRNRQVRPQSTAGLQDRTPLRSVDRGDL